MRFVKVGGLVLATVLFLSGCGAQIPEVPKEVCDADLKKAKVTPLLPEGEKVEVARFHDALDSITCLVSVDDTVALKLRHHNGGSDFELHPAESPGRVKSFKGAMGLEDTMATARARCPGKERGVYARLVIDTEVTSDPEKWEKLEPDARPNMEAFLNAYMPGLLKHYGCG